MKPLHAQAETHPGWKLLLAFPFLVIALFLIQQGTAYAQKVASLEKVQGNVRVFEPGSSRGKKGRNGMALFVSSKIKTMGSSAKADIVYVKGGRVRIMPETEVTLDDTQFNENTTKAKLNLAAGKIFNVVTKLTEGSSYEVQTLTATAGVKGTVFSAETNSRQSTFMVKEGTVQVAAANQDVLVSNLKKSVVPANQRPSQPVPMTPQEIAMFDILDDMSEDIKSDLKEEVMESIKEDIIQDAIERDMMDME